MSILGNGSHCKSRDILSKSSKIFKFLKISEGAKDLYRYGGVNNTTKLCPEFFLYSLAGGCV